MECILTKNSGSLSDAQNFIHNFFESQVKIAPQKIAVIFEDSDITYQELNLRADRLCCSILKIASNEHSIGISATYSIEMIVGILAILKSGKAFMPIERVNDDNKINEMVENAGLKYIICQSEEKRNFQTLGLETINSDYLTDSNTVQNRDSKATIKSDIAYLMYTSGSGGNSKGVEVKHKAIINYIKNAISEYGNSSNQSISSFAHLSLGFDASLTAIFVSLSTGKTLVLASPKYVNRFSDPNFLKYSPYDFLKITPQQFFELEELNSLEAFKVTNKFVVGGETLHYRHFRTLVENQIDAVIYNEYGPSEAGVGSILYKFKAMNESTEMLYGMPVGFAMKGVKAFILNEKLQMVNQGEYGEIVLGGIQVSEKYIGEIDNEESKFIEVKMENGELNRFYRTGDYARVNAFGIIEFACREEKINSIHAKLFHTCLVEREIMKNPLLSNVIVVAMNNRKGVQYPVCYITLNNKSHKLSDIRAHLEDVFREKKYPVFCILLNNFPLTINKKLNRHALPVPILLDDNTCNFQIGNDKVSLNRDVYLFINNSLFSSEINQSHLIQNKTEKKSSLSSKHIKYQNVLNETSIYDSFAQN